jgi:hypothetical protein
MPRPLETVGHPPPTAQVVVHIARQSDSDPLPAPAGSSQSGTLSRAELPHWPVDDQRQCPYGFGGDVAISTTRFSVPVFSIPCSHQGGRYTKSPLATSRLLRANVIVPRPSRMT